MERTSADGACRRGGRYEMLAGMARLPTGALCRALADPYLHDLNTGPGHETLKDH